MRLKSLRQSIKPDGSPDAMPLRRRDEKGMELNMKAGSRMSVVRRVLLAGCLVCSTSVTELHAQRTVIRQVAVAAAKKPKAASVATEAGPVIPGLKDGAIPQGLAFVTDRNKFLISHYFDGQPSCVSVVDALTGKMTACVTLLDTDARPHHGHVGGLAVAGKALFVASDGSVFRYRLSDFLVAEPVDAVAAQARRKCETKASFCTATPTMLFVGEFAYGSRFPTKASHRRKDRKGVRKYAWVCGYDVDDPMGAPTCVISVRQRVQGMCVAGDRVFLSVSYGRTNRSRIVVYRNPIGGEAHEQVELNDDLIPLWFLDGENYLGEVDFPPMSEGIAMVGEQLAVLTEAGASKYLFGGKGPIDRIQLLKVSEFKQREVEAVRPSSSPKPD